jgi:hypothetical protein
MRFASWLRTLKTRWQLPRTHRSGPLHHTQRSRVVPALEALEQRALPSAYVVSTTADSGPGSLRDAINQTNADTSYVLYASPGNPSVDEIDFNITAASDTGGGYNATTGVATITPQAPLPSVNNATLINGYTQAGASKNTLVQGDNAALKIQLNMSNYPKPLSDGFEVGANNTTISGLVFNSVTGNDVDALDLFGASDQVTGCFIGTDVSGTTILGGGTGAFGMEVHSPGGIIGGTTPDTRNLIAGFAVGISLGPAVAEGNYIGTDASGTKALGNQTGVSLTGSGTIGGAVPGAGNLISGNGTGIAVTDNPGLIEGNLIGTDATGTSALGNSTGISLDNLPNIPVTVGGTTAAARNIISGNGTGIVDDGSAEAVIEGNYIGTDVTGTMAVGNSTGIRTFNTDSPIGSDGTVGGTLPGAANVISGNTGQGLLMTGGSGTVVEGNLIGTDASGTKVLGNGDGLVISGESNDTIGGTTSASRNVISANAGNGVLIQNGSGNLVQGNFIGTNASGTAALPNSGTGIVIATDAGGNTVGGTSSAARNIISGNGGDGIDIGTGVGPCSGNVVEDNYIGTNATGTAAVANSGNGILIWNGAAGNTVGGTTSATRNVISGNTYSGVCIGGSSSNNVVQGNYIGTDVTGMTTIGSDGKPLGNGTGVFLNGASGNTIGGTDTNVPGTALAGGGNLVSGDGTGIALAGSSGNVVQGNYVGTDVTGAHALPNTFGIGLSYGATSNWIGTTGMTDSGDRNIVSGNAQTGVYLVFAGTNQNIVGGNYIGTDATGTKPLGNGGAGVAIGWTAQNNQVGGLGLLATTLPNTIAYNGLSGVWVISDGTTGDNTTGNSIRDNSIHDSAGLGIDLGGDYDLSNGTPVPGPDGVTLNDSEGRAAPNNPNNFQDFPILTSAITNKGGVTIIAGSFNSGTVNGAPFEPNTNITVDFYANATPAHPFTDPRTGITHDYGEGQIYLGSQTYKTNANGTFPIAAFRPAVTVPVGYYITATATDPAGNTSEFGPDVLVTLPQNASHGMAQMSASSGNGSGASAGALVPEDLGLYVDNSSGDLTADELARIQDAVAAVDTVTAPYGATIALVTDPALADVTLALDTASAVGGSAAGVLGCYSTGTITLIQGWNWYAGSDPAQVGANQYDFETTLIHELGHALGLGESSDPTSAMSGTLATGTVIRTLTTADLNIPYDEQGPDPQRAVGASPIATGSDPVRVSGRDPVLTTLEAERLPCPSTDPVTGPSRSEVGVSVPAAVRAEALPRLVVSPAAGTADSGRAPLSSIWGEDGSATPDAVALPNAGPSPWDNCPATELSPVFPSESDHGTVRTLPTSSEEGLPFPMPKSDPAETLWPRLCDACFTESNGETGAGPGESLAWAAAVVALGFVLPDPRATPTDERRPSRWLLRG